MQFRVGRRPKDAAHTNEWHRRPVLSALLRVTVFLGPIAASLGIATVLSRVLPRADSAWSAALWIGVVVLGSLVSLVVFERAARRLLPLAALLNVSLLFPDKAPARFAVARQTGSPRDLQRRLDAARAAGKTDDAQGMQAVIELVLALSVHDKGTRGHSERVRVFTDLIADELKIDEAGQARLRWAALLHDVGKLEVPTTILNKAGKPNATEWAVLHRHPEEGARLVAPLLPWLGDWGKAVVQHHERWDGNGYPNGLKGNEICLAARIVSVADTYEVMTAPRPYKRPMSVSASRQELIRVAGTQLDPSIVRAFLNISVGRLWRTIGFGAWIGQIPAISRLFAGFGRVGAVVSSGAATTATAGMLAIGSLGGSGLIGQGHTASAAPPPAISHGSSPHTSSGGTAPKSVAPSASPAPATATPSPSTSSQGTPPVSGGQSGTGGSSGSKPGATPTPTATPQPTPPPGTACAPGSANDPCSNNAAGCLTYCHAQTNSSLCTQFCEVSGSLLCTSHCWGNNNAGCLSYCYGNNNAACSQNCYNAAGTCTLNCTARAIAVLFKLDTWCLRSKVRRSGDDMHGRTFRPSL